MHLAFFKAATWRVIAMASLLLTSLYSLWLYTAYIVPERYGVLALAMTLVAYMANMDGGFRTVINRAILGTSDARKRDDLLAFGQKLYSVLSGFIIAGNLVVMAMYALTPGPRAENVGWEFFATFGVTNAVLVAANIQAGVFIGAQEQSKFFILQTLGAWAGVNALSWGFSKGWELWAIPFASIVSFVATYPLSVRWIKKRFPRLRIFDLLLDEQFRTNFRALKTEAWFCFRAQITTLVLYSADILIIGYFCRKSEVAVYYVIIRLIGMTRSLLQTVGEVGWPFLAQRGGVKGRGALPWFGLHGWVYGSVAGALAVVTVPFCRWYMGSQWTISDELLWVIVLRFLIVGLGSSATYLLYAVGDFRSITRCLEGELIAGLVLGGLGGYAAGSLGVATGFLFATAGGTLVPVYVTYADRGDVSFWQIFATVWSRAGVGFLGSYFTAVLLLSSRLPGIYIPFIASAAVAAGLLLAFFVALTRQGFHLNFDAQQLKQLLRKV
jgi:O-antigen/teichoic acid export membrane protein